MYQYIGEIETKEGGKKTIITEADDQQQAMCQISNRTDFKSWSVTPIKRYQ